jgi:hypothetical protein
MLSTLLRVVTDLVNLGHFDQIILMITFTVILLFVCLLNILLTRIFNNLTNLKAEKTVNC